MTREKKWRIIWWGVLFWTLWFSVPLRASTLQTVADVSCSSTAAVVTAAGGAGQECVQVANIGANAVRVGDANVTATRGTPLLVSGPPETICTNDAIYCFSTSGTTVSVLILNK